MASESGSEKTRQVPTVFLGTLAQNPGAFSVKRNPSVWKGNNLDPQSKAQLGPDSESIYPRSHM